MVKYWVYRDLRIPSGNFLYPLLHYRLPEMEIRKVQMTGGSSYVLTLPKDWITSLNIRKNDPVGVVVQPSGDLMITGNVTGTMIPRIKRLDLEPGTDPTGFFRILVGVYIAGYNIIEIRSKDRISSTIRRTVREFSDLVIGLEPVEEHDFGITLRDLFNPLEMPFLNSFQRMNVITRGMLTDSVEALKNHDPALAQDVVLRDRDVDRLYWLIERQTNMILQSPRNVDRVSMDITEVLHYCQTSRIMERIADHAVTIAESIRQIDPERMDPQTMAAICSDISEGVKMLDQSVAAFTSRDLKQANRVIGSVQNLQNAIHQVNIDILTLPTDMAVYVRRITGSIRRIGEYSSDIGEQVINFGMNSK